LENYCFLGRLLVGTSSAGTGKGFVWHCFTLVWFARRAVGCACVVACSPLAIAFWVNAFKMSVNRQEPFGVKGLVGSSRWKQAKMFKP
jgi:hypothetical protein